MKWIAIICLTLILNWGVNVSQTVAKEDVAGINEKVVEEIVVSELDTKKREQEEVSRAGYRTMNMEITFYSEHFESCGKYPSDPAYGIMASGQYVRVGAVAADTRILPMYSIIYIEGMGQFEVLDRGGDIKGNRLDVYVTSHNEAIQLGRQYRKIYIIRMGKG